MRILSYLLALLVLCTGLLFGALNPAPVQVDLYLRAFELALSPALLLAMLAGALLGGSAVLLGMVLPLRRRLARQQREAAASSRSLALATDDHGASV